jgi:hypothetical protein
MANRLSVTRTLAVCAGALLGGALTAATAAGQVRLLVPEQSPSGPFYARVSYEHVHQTDEWVAIAFYREPDCVRPNFDLLNFYDFANIPAIFMCPLTVHGFELWSDPATDPAPKQSRLEGNGAVPVWFISAADFHAALPGVTIEELLDMPSLMQGEATRFEETLHPYGPLGTMLQLVAHGTLPDGRTFNYVGIETSNVLRHVAIEFK